MSFKDQMRILSNQNREMYLKEKRTGYFDINKYDEYTNLICEDIKSNIQEKIIKKLFHCDKSFWSKQYYYSSGINLEIRVTTENGDENYSISGYNNEWGDHCGYYLKTQYFDDIYQTLVKVSKELQKDFDEWRFHLVFSNRKVQKCVNIDTIMLYLKKHQINFPQVITSSCEVIISAKLYCSNTGLL